ncbi:hypothetical protein [Nonomuraea sp. NPDC049684]
MHLGLATAWWITAGTVLATVVLFPRTAHSGTAPVAAPQAAPEPVGSGV